MSVTSIIAKFFMSLRQYLLGYDMQNYNYGNIMMSSTVSVKVMPCKTFTMVTE